MRRPAGVTWPAAGGQCPPPGRLSLPRWPEPEPWSQVMLPPDGHVHTEWSWDAAAGSMERSCARAVALGLPSIAFTEHADFTGWVVDPEVRVRMRAENAARLLPDGRFRPPPLDVSSYLAC